MNEKPPLPPDIEIRPSAFKHGYTEQDVRSAFSSYFLNKPIEGRDGIEVLLGFSSDGEALEPFFEVVDGRYVVFHMMKCRKQFLEQCRKR